VNLEQSFNVYQDEAAAPEQPGLALGVLLPARPALWAFLRVLDVFLAIIVSLVLLPLFALLALAVRLDSAGPVLFAQNRVGRDGREFRFFKFRSMQADAEVQRLGLEGRNERSGPVFKIRRDPRVTRVGRILRKYSLDELPQLLNVLRGDMTLVGPRPALPAEVARYTPRQRQRLHVTPGLTGLWQVSGRASLSFERSIELDLFYIQRQSLWLNLRILALTVPAVLSAEGAY
jgi:lipopolysaccharide/colanic/teichoic acid biosynthesis glycosyltransferase